MTNRASRSNRAKGTSMGYVDVGHENSTTVGLYYDDQGSGQPEEQGQPGDPRQVTARWARLHGGDRRHPPGPPGGDGRGDQHGEDGPRGEGQDEGHRVR